MRVRRHAAVGMGVLLFGVVLRALPSCLDVTPIIVVKDSSATSTKCVQCVESSTGCASLIAACRSSTENPWSIYWVHFMGESADLLYQRYAEQNQPGKVIIPYEEKRILAFNEIYDLVENSFDRRETEISNIKLLDFISSFIFHKEINPSLQEKNVITDSINFMKSNLHQNISLEELADRQHLSVSHYCRLFAAKTGRSPHQYFNQLKIWQTML